MSLLVPMHLARSVVVAGVAMLLAAGTAPAQAGRGFRAGTAEDFSGEWHFASADGTYEEVLELAVRGTEVTGELIALQHGYFSSRTTEKARLVVRGALTNGALQW